MVKQSVGHTNSMHQLFSVAGFCMLVFFWNSKSQSGEMIQYRSFKVKLW